MKSRKVKIHFNRVNMQRKNPNVWSAHTSESCNMSSKVIVMHNGKTILETIYDPDKKNNPRAFMVTKGIVKHKANGVTVIET